jgi:hypothetical protein
MNGVSPEKRKKEFVGKYVVYDRMDGGACFGRIVDEGVVNTLKGEREVFLLDNRIVRYARTTDQARFRRFFPDAAEPSASVPGSLSSDGSFRAGGVFMETSRVKGVTTLRKESIDLERDVVDASDLLELVDDETLFLALLGGRERGVPVGRDAAEMGLMDMLASDSSPFREEVKAELARRLESKRGKVG